MSHTTSPHHAEMIVPTTIEQVPAIYRKGNGAKFKPHLDSIGAREARRIAAAERVRLALAEAMGSQSGHVEGLALLVLAVGILAATLTQWGF